MMCVWRLISVGGVCTVFYYLKRQVSDTGLDHDQWVNDREEVCVGARGNCW